MWSHLHTHLCARIKSEDKGRLVCKRKLQPCELTQQFLWIDQSQPGTLFLHCSCTCFLSHSLGQNLYALYIQPMEFSHSHKSVKIVVVEIDTILQRPITCSTSTCETIWEIDSALTPAFIGNQDVQEDGGWWCGRMERIEGTPSPQADGQAPGPQGKRGLWEWSGCLGSPHTCGLPHCKP